MSVRIRILDWSFVFADERIISAFGEAERARLERINNPRYKQESEAALVALRELLGKAFSGNIIRDATGRPRFENLSDMDFNISHSGKLCAVALLLGKGRVGIDLELVNDERQASLSRIANRYFSESEKNILADNDSITEFYKIWTSKEAVAKCSGEGLSRLLEKKETVSGGQSLSQFTVEYGTQRYLLSVCTEEKVDEIEFVCDDGIVALVV